MLQIIAGNKGKGKTVILLDKANAAIKETNGTIVYIDKNNSHMHDLNNKVRLIDASQYPIRSYDAFVGFVCGIVAQDFDLQEIYFDGFLKVAKLEAGEIAEAVKELAAIAETNKINMTLSISADEKDLPEEVKPFISVSL